MYGVSKLIVNMYGVSIYVVNMYVLSMYVVNMVWYFLLFLAKPGFSLIHDY